MISQPVQASVQLADGLLSSTSSVARATLVEMGQRLCNVDAPPAPQPSAVLSIPPDTTERIEKFFSMRAFGMGAELFPFLGVGEARAMRLVCQRFHVAVDRRAWPVRGDTMLWMTCKSLQSAPLMLCVCVSVCLTYAHSFFAGAVIVEWSVGLPRHAS